MPDNFIDCEQEARLVSRMKFNRAANSLRMREERIRDMADAFKLAIFELKSEGISLHE